MGKPKKGHRERKPLVRRQREVIAGLLDTQSIVNDLLTDACRKNISFPQKLQVIAMLDYAIPLIRAEATKRLQLQFGKPDVQNKKQKKKYLKALKVLSPWIIANVVLEGISIFKPGHIFEGHHFTARLICFLPTTISVRVLSTSERTIVNEHERLIVRSICDVGRHVESTTTVFGTLVYHNLLM